MFGRLAYTLGGQTTGSHTHFYIVTQTTRKMKVLSYSYDIAGYKV